MAVFKQRTDGFTEFQKILHTAQRPPIFGEGQGYSESYAALRTVPIVLDPTPNNPNRGTYTFKPEDGNQLIAIGTFLTTPVLKVKDVHADNYQITWSKWL